MEDGRCSVLPVVTILLHFPPKVRGVLHPLSDQPRLVHQLLRNASHVHTSACTIISIACSPQSGSVPGKGVQRQGLTGKSHLQAPIACLSVSASRSPGRRPGVATKALVTMAAGINGRDSTKIITVVPFFPASLLPWSMQVRPSPLQLRRGRNQIRAPPRPHFLQQLLHGGQTIILYYLAGTTYVTTQLFALCRSEICECGICVRTMAGN